MTAAKHIAFCKAEHGVLFSHALAVFLFDRWAQFGSVSSSLHDIWTRTYTSYNLALPRYIHTDCFLTFPFPIFSSTLDSLSEEYHNHRQLIMKSRQQGLTTTYNQFHDKHANGSDIVRLRELHKTLDYAIVAAYGWQDLDLGHGFHETKQGVRFTISEPARRIVLDRLLALNHEHYEEEVKTGLHEKKAAKSAVKGRGQKSLSDKKENQYKMFEE